MTDSRGLTVLLEFNCEYSPTLTSVWVVPRAIEEGSAEFDELPNVPGAVRLIGPADHRTAEGVYNGLVSVLSAAAQSFRHHVISDD